MPIKAYSKLKKHIISDLFKRECLDGYYIIQYFHLFITCAGAFSFEKIP
jgi:hypothetical protein